MPHTGRKSLIDRITAGTFEAIRRSQIYLPDDVKQRIQAAYDTEESLVARRELSNILENIRLAEEREAPLCQDTGIPVVYLSLPEDVSWSKAMADAVYAGVRLATEKVPLRPNLVDPMSRHNTLDNTGCLMPPIHIRYGDRLIITVLPKGAGSENVSEIRMCNPSDVRDIPQFIVETVMRAGGRPCPPIILGVGVGGTFDMAAAFAKEALLEPVDTMTAYEQEICDAVNELGIGPMGLGGKTTCLAVKVKTAGCHTASLPVAVNIQCWAARRATVEV